MNVYPTSDDGYLAVAEEDINGTHALSSFPCFDEQQMLVIISHIADRSHIMDWNAMDGWLDSRKNIM